MTRGELKTLSRPKLLELARLNAHPFGHRLDAVDDESLVNFLFSKVMMDGALRLDSQTDQQRSHARAELMATAAQLVDRPTFATLDSKSDREIRIVLLGILAPDLKLDGLRDSELEAHLDARLERDPTLAAPDADLARRRMVEDGQNAWRGKSAASGGDPRTDARDQSRLPQDMRDEPDVEDARRRMIERDTNAWQKGNAR